MTDDTAGAGRFARDARGGFPLFRLAGIQVRVDPSWFLIFALIWWSLAAGYFPRLAPEAGVVQSWAAGLLAALLFFGSLLFHELSHALVARHAGLEVPTITLFLFGGASEMAREPDDPATELRIAIVGPFASFLLALVFWATGALLPADTPALLAGVVDYLAWINLALGVFNLLPGFPLDGGRVLRALLWQRTGSLRRASRVATRAGKGLGLGLAVLGGLQIFSGALLGGRVLRALLWQRTGSLRRASRVATRAGKGLGLGLAVLGGLQIFSGALLGGIWLVLIGLFARGLAESSYQSLMLRQLLAEVSVAEVMVREPVTVAPDLPLDRLVEDFILGQGLRGFPVVEDGRVLGLVSLDRVKAVPPEQRAQQRVRDQLEALDDAQRVAPDTPLLEAMAQMSRAGARRLLVLEPGSSRLLGLLTGSGLTRFVELRRALESTSA